LDLLSRREHTQRELLEKMQRRGFESVICMLVIEQLAEVNLQSDERFAELFAEQRVAKGFGEYKVKADLRDRGVGSALVEQAMACLSVDWVANAQRVAYRKFKDLGTDFTSKEHLKCRRFLLSRGFSAMQINAALSNKTEL
jgi:regulatory protein